MQFILPLRFWGVGLEELPVLVGPALWSISSEHLTPGHCLLRAKSVGGA